MLEMSKDELIETKGGEGFLLGVAIVAAIVFLIGVVDGFVHPKKCND